LKAKDRQARIAHAADRNFAGLRFDGQYRTTSPIELDATLTQFLELQLRFREDLNAEVTCRHWATDNGEIENEEDHSEVIAYCLSSDDTIRFGLDADTWIYDWEGQVVENCLQLTYRMEEWFGIAGHPKCVVEGEAFLVFHKD
jgi:hypothetical protein